MVSIFSNSLTITLTKHPTKNKLTFIKRLNGRVFFITSYVQQFNVFTENEQRQKMNVGRLAAVWELELQMFNT